MEGKQLIGYKNVDSADELISAHTVEAGQGGESPDKTNKATL